MATATAATYYTSSFLLRNLLEERESGPGCELFFSLADVVRCDQGTRADDDQEHPPVISPALENS